MTLLATSMLLQLSEGLRRQSSVQCSRWAENYITLGKPLPGPITFRYHPWQIDMLNCDGDWVGLKAAQAGYTSVALIRSLFTIDMRNNSVLYVLPKWSPDASDFSKDKFDPLLELSPHLASLFSSTRNVGHKQAGSASFFLRGARSRSGLKTISTALKIFDEFDEMPKSAVVLGEERSAGYLEKDKQTIKVSTATAPDMGIDAEFKLSTQESYFFKCPHCSKFITLKFPESLVITANDVMDEENLRKSHLICHECKHPLDHATKSEWLRSKWQGGSGEFVPKVKGPYTRGFHISQLFTVVEPWRIAKSFLLAKDDPIEEQEFYNSKLGLAHLVEGARVTDLMLTSLRSTHSIHDPAPENQMITMGVDVGKKLHVQIDQWMLPPVLGPDLNMLAIKRVIRVMTVDQFEELDRLMHEYDVQACVIDANPEYRKAYEFAMRFHGHVFLCYFKRGIDGKNIQINRDICHVGVKRTSWLDLSQGRFHKGTKAILLPHDITNEYLDHIKAIMRIERRNEEGEIVAKYVSSGPDHYAFTNCYSDIALPIAASVLQNQDIRVYL